MSVAYIRDQWLLIAMSEYKVGVILHAEGEGVTGEMEYSEYLADHFSDNELPKLPGFYMWEGDIWIDDGQSYMGEPADPDVRWVNGAFRKARPDEVIRWIRKHHRRVGADT